MSDAASAPLTPEQIREGLLRIARHIGEFYDDDVRREQPETVTADLLVVDAALTLCDSQALALTQAHQEIETQKQWRDGYLAKARELSAANEALTAERDALKQALTKLAIDGVTAGANPQKGGGMSPPLWHMHCLLCDTRWSKQQWQRPTEHPLDTRVLNPPCILAPTSEAKALKEIDTP